MSILEVGRWILYVVEFCLLASVFYLVLLSLAALKGRSGQRVSHAAATEASPRFAIVVPAHNEEVMLETLLKSLAELSYPKDLYTVYVVADNCTDRTAELARATGWVEVYERFDEQRRGKGYALNWVFQRLEAEPTLQPYDAYVVLDADSVLEPGFLQPFAEELQRGELALQACNTVLNIHESPSTALRWIALTLMNHVRPLGRNALGASATLTGNGMCLSRELVRRYPWQAFSVGEDYQYYLNLVAHGERVHYVPEAVVRSHMPPRFAQMRTQDIRWESSTPGQSSTRTALGLLWNGLRLRDGVRFEAALELLVPPLSLLVSGTLLVLLASLVLWTLPGAILGLLLLLGLSFYLGTALYLLRPPIMVYKALLLAPGFVFWKLWVYLILKRNKKLSGEWVRTSRTTSAD